MPKLYRHSNGRIEHRTSTGKFRRSTLQDIGIAKSEIQEGSAICKNCGYGKNEIWLPILKTGYCPKCKSQEKEEKEKAAPFVEGKTDDVKKSQ
jgi:predicted nucleic-acid-binding Zn-ribbon protein